MKKDNIIITTSTLVFIVLIAFSYVTTQNKNVKEKGNATEHLSSSESSECHNANHEKKVKLYLEGFDEYSNGHYVKAIDLFKESIRLDPNCPGIFQQYRELIHAYVAIGDKANVEKYLLIAIPKTYNTSVKSEFYSLLARLYHNSGNFEKCIKACSEAIIYDKNNVEAYFVRALAKMEYEDIKGAFTDLSAVIARYESTLDLAKNSNEMDMQLLELERIQYREIIGKAYFYRGLIFLKYEQMESACDQWSKAGETGYTDAYSYISRYCN